jgi:5-methylcytosine-specific restriction endonuclease McrA
MKTYTKTYFDYFGYTIADFIPCEMCGKKSVDIHHVWARSVKSELVNEISNLMALCRSCHQEYGDKKQHRQMLQDKHNEILKTKKL